MSEQIKDGPPRFAAVNEPTVTEEGAAPRVVLLAEDDRSIRRYLEVILQKAGYTVIAASDGLEAMQAALTTHVDAVVTDAIMPNISGHELCRFLRSQAKLSHVPVILLSGLANDVAETARESGADGYLVKPVSPAELISCLERLL